MTKDLVIIGAGGFGREASLLVEEINKAEHYKAKWNLLGFIDDDYCKRGVKLRGYPVLGGFADLSELSAGVSAICVVGEPAYKKKMVEQVKNRGLHFANLIHPEVELSADVSIGEGVLINKGCLLTTNIIIGNHVSINPGCGIGHDAVIGDYTTLMWRVNISGAVQIDEGCMIGSGTTILQGRSIGESVLIGAGAVVINDLQAKVTVAGVPAKVIQSK